MNSFSRISLKMTKMWLNLYSLSQVGNIREEKLSCVHKRTAVLFVLIFNRNQTLDAGLYTQKLQHVYGNHLRKRHTLVNKRKKCVSLWKRKAIFSKNLAGKNIGVKLVCCTVSNIFTRPYSKCFPSISFSAECSEYQKKKYIFSRISGKNLCKKNSLQKYPTWKE